MASKSIRFIPVIVALLSTAISDAQSSWTTWNKYPGNPVYSNMIPGGWNAASDPSVIKDSTDYRMVVSGTEGNGGCSIEGNYIVQLTSSNGIQWDTISNSQNGIVIKGCPGDWDESMEMPEMIKLSNTYSIFYCGYDPAIAQSSGGLVWGDLGLAESTNGINYTKILNPVMTLTPNWYDQDGITDPTIIESGDTLYMIYVGWCTQSCSLNNGDPAFYSLKAISLDNGHTWTKQGLLDPTGIIGLQHPDLVYDADGKYSLFFGVDNACIGNKIGVFHSVGNSPFGPFLSTSSNPVFCLGTQGFETSGTDGAFPAVINDNGMGRMWYTGVDDINFHYKIGLAESNNFANIENEQNNLFSIFPNPVKNELNLELSIEIQNGELKIYNLSGHTVKSVSNLNGKNINIETVELVNGIYFLQLKEDDMQIEGKFVVNK